MLGSDNKLTKIARDAFTTQVLLLLTGGNKGGKGPKISSLVGTFPPVPGPKFVDPDRLLLNPADPLGTLFWFDPSPLALLMTSNLIDPEKDYQKIIVTNLYEPLVKMLNMPGNIVVPTLFDLTCFFDINVDLPELLLALPTPALQLAFSAKFKISADIFAKFAVDLPKLPAPPPIPPSLPIPPIPNFDFIIFPDLFLGMLSIPLEILKPDFVISLIGLPPSPPDLFIKIGTLVLDLMLKLLVKLGLLVILPKLLVATIVIILQNMVSMLVCDMIGVILGTGQLVKAAGSLLGLS